MAYGRLKFFTFAAIFFASACHSEPRIFVSDTPLPEVFKAFSGTIAVVLVDPKARRAFALIKGRYQSIADARSVWGTGKQAEEPEVKIASIKDQQIRLRGAYSISPDQKIAAAAFYLKENGAVTYDIALIDRATNSVRAKTTRPHSRRIVGIAWSPDGQNLALLTDEWKVGLWPFELLAALTGHSVEHNDFYLEILNDHLIPVTEARLADGFNSGGGAIKWINKELSAADLVTK